MILIVFLAYRGNLENEPLSDFTNIGTFVKGNFKNFGVFKICVF